MKKIIFLALVCTVNLISSSTGFTSSDIDSWIVVKDHMEVHENPSENSAILKIISLGYSVTLLEKEKNIDLGQEIDEWLYIDTHFSKKGGSLKGWVKKEYLADRGKFLKVNHFRKCTINQIIGGVLFNYQFYSNGAYKRKILNKNEYGKIISESFIHGNLYQYGKVIIAADGNKNNSSVVFYLNNNGLLCFPGCSEQMKCCPSCD